MINHAANAARHNLRHFAADIQHTQNDNHHL